MKATLARFRCFPSVVRANEESEITVRSYDSNFCFCDDITYEVRFVPQDISDVPLDYEITLLGYEKSRETYFVKPQNGELKLRYFFSGEQEWRIHISTKEYKKHQNPMYENYKEHWWPKIEAPKRGIDLFVYSLSDDLYNRRVLRGDLHVHTSASDGDDSAQAVCAVYRKAGRDFLAVTDHHVYNASKHAKEKLSFVKNFHVLCGEEVHNRYVGAFHMVNVGSDYSVNEIYLSDPDRVEKEAMALEGEVEIPQGLDKHEYLHRVWLYRAIKKSGGFAVFPHPFWSVGYLNTSTKMSEAIIKNGLCDAFEVLGGTGSVARNNMQLALYNDLRAQGYDIPIVGSTDSHQVIGCEYTAASTVVFAENDDILSAVRDKYSVAVESVTGEQMRVYGKRRLVFYTHFLLQNYFPLHDELCAVSGTNLCQYFMGNDDAKADVVRAEEKIEQFEKSFFGR